MKYVGITIGPIFKTINGAISPAGLWYASTFFSEVSKHLCYSIKEELPNVTIFSPYVGNNTKFDGIGKFHDRILFSAKEVKKETLKKIIEDTKLKLKKLLADSEEDSDQTSLFLTEYFHIDFVIFDEKDLLNKNIVIHINNALDSLELMMVSTSQNEYNLFQKYFIGKEDNRNDYIKKSGLFNSIDNDTNFLVIPNDKNGNLKSIETIVDVSDAKKLPYFVVVNSDGDKIGQLLSNMCQDEEGQILNATRQSKKVLEFSKCCMDYATEAANCVNNNGGMIIYAGGDDLLFLAPVNHLFKLVNKLNRLFLEKFLPLKQFDESIDSKKINLSLSFGVSIQYVKYPLYESLDVARLNLSEAKEKGGNTTSVTLRKHSGRSVQMSFTNAELKNISNLMQDLKELDEAVLQSVEYKVVELSGVFEELFKETTKEGWTADDFFSRFKNIFDNVHQETFEPYLRKISDFYHEHYLLKSSEEKMDYVRNFQNILRLINFGKGVL